MLPVAVIATFHHDGTLAYWIYLHFQTRLRITWRSGTRSRARNAGLVRHTFHVSGVTLAISPGWRSRRRLWRLLACLACAAVALAVLAIDADRFLYGAAPVLRLGGSPAALAVSPGGRMIYLADSPGSIIPVSAATGKPGKAILVSGGTTGDLAYSKLTITPDGRTLFALLIGLGAGGVPQIVRVDLRTGKETGQFQVPGGAYDFAPSSDDATLYVVSGDNTLIAVDAVTGRPERRIPVPANLLAGEGAMVLSPDGGTLYVTTTDQDAQAGAVTPVSLRTGAPGRAVSVGWEPESLAITPDGRTLYAAVDGMMGPSGQVAPNRVVAIDTATDRVRASLQWQAPPLYLAMAPNGATLWVASIGGDRGSTADDTVTPVSVGNDRPGTSFRTAGWLNVTDDGPSGMAMSPGGRTLYVTVSTGLETFGLP